MKNLSNLNKDLLCKWNCDNANNKGVLWIDVIRGKYGEEEGRWCSSIPREGFGWVCIFWKARNDIVFRDEVLTIQRYVVFFCISSLVKDQVVFCGCSYASYAFH